MLSPSPHSNRVISRRNKKLNYRISSLVFYGALLLFTPGCIEIETDRFTNQIRLAVQQLASGAKTFDELPSELDDIGQKAIDKVNRQLKETGCMVGLKVDSIRLELEANRDQLLDGLYFALVKIHTEGCDSDAKFLQILSEIEFKPVFPLPRFCTPGDCTVRISPSAEAKLSSLRIPIVGMGFQRPDFDEGIWHAKLIQGTTSVKEFANAKHLVTIVSDNELDFHVGAMLEEITVEESEYYAELSFANAPQSVVRARLQFKPQEKELERVTFETERTLKVSNKRGPTPFKLFQFAGAPGNFDKNWGNYKYREYVIPAQGDKDFWSSAMATLCGRIYVEGNKLFYDLEYGVAEWWMAHDRDFGPRDNYSYGLEETKRVLLYTAPEGYTIHEIVTSTHFAQSKLFEGDETTESWGGPGELIKTANLKVVGWKDSIGRFTEATVFFNPIELLLIRTKHTVEGAGCSCE